MNAYVYKDSRQLLLLARKALKNIELEREREVEDLMEKHRRLVARTWPIFRWMLSEPDPWLAKCRYRVLSDDIKSLISALKGGAGKTTLIDTEFYALILSWIKVNLKQ